MAKRRNWTEEENRALVALYARMRSYVDHSAKYSKAAMIREVQQLGLIDRSRGSIEAKLMNVSYLLDVRGRDDLSMARYGYKPAPKRAGKALALAVDEWLDIVNEEQRKAYGVAA